MSNDQIIRSSKPHEVTIPEGSNSARSIRNKLGHREVEQEREEKVSVDKQYTDRTVQAENEALSDRQVQVGQTDATRADNAISVQEGAQDPNRIRVPGATGDSGNQVKIDDTAVKDRHLTIDTADDHSSNRVAVPQSGQDDHRVALPAGSRETDNFANVPADTQGENRALLPTDSARENRALLPTDSTSDNTVSIDSQARSGNRATHDDDAHHDTHAQIPEQASASSMPVSIPADNIQDSFAQVPDMNHTDSPPVKVDGHGITDPARVVVEDSPAEHAEVSIPVAVPETAPAAPVEVEKPHEVAEAAPVVAPPVVAVRAEPTQVRAHPVDKKSEEFRGRVVKLRDEVDQLNRRLDDIKK
jgi:hypothetical protein